MHIRSRRAGSRGQLAVLAALLVATSLTTAAGLTSAAAQPSDHSGPPVYLDCDASPHPTEDVQLPSGSGSSKSIGCWVMNAARKSVTSGSIKVSAEVVTSVNDPESPDAATYSSADYWCYTQSTGFCSVPIHQAEGELGTTTICFYLESAPGGGANCGSELWDEALNRDKTDHANDLEDAVRVTWHPPTPFVDRLDASPDQNSRPLGSPAPIKAVLYDQFGNQFTGAGTVQFELFAGSPTDADGNTPSSPDGTCSNASNGCTFTYTQSSTTGWDFVCVWVGATPSMGTDAEGAETCNGETYADPDEVHGIFPTIHSPGDKVDLVYVAWSAGTPLRGIDCDDQPGSPTSEHQAVPTLEGPASQVTYSCTVYNDSGSPTGPNHTIRAEVREPVNDPDATDGASFGSPDYTCNTGNSPTCTITVTQADGETGRTEVCFYLGSAKEGQSLCSWELRDEGGINDQVGDSANDLADTVSISWEVRSAANGGLDVEPDSGQVKVGSKQVLTATVYDQLGDPFSGQNAVKFRFAQGSLNYRPTPSSLDPHRVCWTNGSATCAITVTADTVGSDDICVWVHEPPPLPCGEQERDDDDAPGVMDSPVPVDDDVDRIHLFWNTAGAALGGVDAEPETVTRSLKEKHVVSATVYDQFGDEFTGNTRVNIELFSGSPGDSDGNTPASPDLSCTTASASTCAVAFTSVAAGTTRMCVWTSGTPSLRGTNLTGTCDSEPLGDADDAAGSPDPPSPTSDHVDVVQVVWQT